MSLQPDRSTSNLQDFIQAPWLLMTLEPNKTAHNA